MSNKVDSFGTSYFFKKINEKEPIIFIHGVGLTKEIWDPQVNFFKDYNIVTYDLLGHGETPIKKNSVSFEDFTEQLLRLINDLNFNKFHLIGFSLGALIARHFAAENNNRLASLILHGSIYKRNEDQKRVVKNRFEVAKMGRYSILDKNNLSNFLKSYEIFVNYIDNDSILKKIETNTLITTGENDVGSTPEMSNNLSKIIPRSKFIKIKKGKHLCSIECADDVNITFKKFIDQNND